MSALPWDLCRPRSGHQHLPFGPASWACLLGLPLHAEQGLDLTVLTFVPHPLSVTSAETGSGGGTTGQLRSPNKLRRPCLWPVSRWPWPGRAPHLPCRQVAVHLPKGRQPL